MLVFALVLVLGLLPQVPLVWHLPVTIKTLEDVPVEPYPQGYASERRGVLYIGRMEKPFVIKRGKTFQMTAVQDEGGCRIRFDKKSYDIASCHWLDGFPDRQADVFRVVGQR